MMSNDNNNELIPEKTALKLGFVPLTDCCVLAIAKEKGFFVEQGLNNVELSKEASWANIRDKVSVGALDGAQMLSGMPIATTLGLGFTQKDMVTAFGMDLNGNAITVSNKLYEQLIEIDPSITSKAAHTALALKKLIERNKSELKPKLTFAMVYPYSNHNYELRYWMASAGINPEHDVVIRAIPPQYMVNNLEEQQIDAFCVGEPWNSRAVGKGVGKIIISGYEIWNNSPEKVFAVTREWAEKNPNTHVAVIKALLQAAMWADKVENREEVANILANENYIGISADIIKCSLIGLFPEQYAENGIKSIPDFNVFYRYLANYPWCSDAAWVISQMYRWGQLNKPLNIKQLAETVYRPDIFREAANQLGITCPTINYKSEGEHADAWMFKDNDLSFELGADTFFDNKTYSIDSILEYISDFEVHAMEVDMKELAMFNA